MKLVTQLLPLAAFAVSQQPEAQIPIAPDTALPVQPSSLETIPALGYGTWNLKGDNVSDAVSLAIQTGYRHIDCAAIYRNEPEVGKGISDGLAKAGLSRDDIWITSKLWNDHHGANHVEDGLRKTLHDLGLQYLDLYHMHWPVSSDSDGNKIEYKDTWEAMTLMLEKGLTRHIGVSNFSPEQLKDLLNTTSHPPTVHQMEMHPYLQQNEWLDFHKDHGIHVTAYSPLAGTNPTYNSGEDVPLLQNKALLKIAHKRGCTPAQAALVWGMSRGTSVIPKAQHADYIEENFAAPQCELKEKDLKKIDKLGAQPHRYNNPSKSWKLRLYQGLEDAQGAEDYRLRK